MKHLRDLFFATHRSPRSERRRSGRRDVIRGIVFGPLAVATWVSGALSSSSGCGGPGVDAAEASKREGAGPSASSVPPLARLRISGIPDADKDKLSQQFEVATRYLSERLGMPVQYIHMPNYTAAVTALAANKVDVVWLGGVTAVQAEQRTGGQARFVVARESDLRFKSYFIANSDWVKSNAIVLPEGREPMALEQLATLRAHASKATLSFGSKNSTSGHIMPRHFLQRPEVGLSPDEDFVGKARYQMQGGHSATLAAVASGAVDVGAINYKAWEKADAATQAAAPIVYVTPHYVDYCLVAHERIGERLLSKLAESFVTLDPANARDAEVLGVFGAQAFVAADSAAWDGIRGVLADLEAQGNLE